MFKNRREPNRNEQRNLQNSPHGPSNSQFTSGTTNVDFARESRFNKPRENQSRQRNNNNNQNVDRVEFAREFDTIAVIDPAEMIEVKEILLMR